MPDAAKLAAMYTLFAAIAMSANICAQDMVVRLCGGGGGVIIIVSVAVGTGVGLIVKYVLDKKYIFHFRVNNVLHDGKTFVLYTVMGGLTTCIFWGFEFGFHMIFESESMRYIGGIVGLIIGYFIKYQLDKRYVFEKHR